MLIVSSIYLIPIFYALSIYSITFSVLLGWNVPRILLLIPLLFGVSNYLVAFLLNKEKNDKIFTSAVIVKYSLIPFFIMGGIVICFCFLLGIIPHLSFLMISNIVFIFTGYLILVLGSAYQIAHIKNLIENHEISLLFGIVLIILSLVFTFDVISVMMLSLLKNKHRKLTIAVIIVLLALSMAAIVWFIYSVFMNARKG